MSYFFCGAGLRPSLRVTKERRHECRRGRPEACSTMLFIVAACAAWGQGRGPAKPSAPVDLTGYWVSIVTEDWRYRMVTPVKSDYPSIPLNPEGRKVADAWDPAKDEGAGNQCKSYGIGNIMRQPGRVHITWD